jgi:hypothetical protein
MLPDVDVFGFAIHNIVFGREECGLIVNSDLNSIPSQISLNSLFSQIASLAAVEAAIVSAS